VTTLLDMINEVSMNLSGYTLQQDRATHITADVAATASTIAAPITLSLASTDSVGKGIIEIDEELFWVDNYDRVGNTATIAPYGRAYLGTTLAAHTEGTKVTIAPTFPRFTIKRAINDTINAIGASIFAASTTTITSNAAVAAFRLPTTGTTLSIRKILSIAYQTLGASKEWTPIRSYRFDGNANSTAFTSGQTVSIYDYIPSGRTVQVVYATDPVAFTDSFFAINNKALTTNVATLTTSAAHGFAVGDIVGVSGVDSTFDGDFTVVAVPTTTTFTYAKTATDVISAAVSPTGKVGITFADKTGLPESCKDLVILGATYRLLSNLDPARASMVSPQADEVDSKRPYGSSQSLTKQVYALFNQRLNEEIKNQQDKYPIRVHYSL
jgi:hypothetical protein